MEKEGLQRVLKFLQQEKLTTEVLVTDRHYDVWHVAKGEMNLFVGLFWERGGFANCGVDPHLR